MKVSSTRKRKQRWKSTCNRFVAFLDIMGFEDLVSRLSHEELKENLEKFQYSVALIEKGRVSRPREGSSREKGIIKPVIFSDSVLLVSQDGSSESAYNLRFEVTWIIDQALKVGIPMKGAIAYGEQTSDFGKSLHFGRPLIDAFELQKEILMYSVVLHHTAETRLIELKDITDPLDISKYTFLRRYKVPMRDGEISHYVVYDDGLAKAKEGAKYTKRVSDLYCSVSGKPRLYVDNTLRFLKWADEEARRVPKATKNKQQHRVKGA